MDATILTVIGSGVGLFVAMSIVIHLSYAWLKNELKAELRQGFAEFKLDLSEARVAFMQDRIAFRRDRAEARAESKRDRAEQQAESKRDQAEQRAESKRNLAEKQAESKQDLAASNADWSIKVQADRAEIITTRRILYLLSLHRHGIDGLPMAPLTDALDPPDFGSGSDNGESGNPLD